MVVIKDFGMPSCCMNCEMQIDGLSAGYYCAITEEDLNDNSTLEHRHPNCPLVEIEEHKVGKWVPIWDSDHLVVLAYQVPLQFSCYDSPFLKSIV